jgi:hypothetical protein
MAYFCGSEAAGVSGRGDALAGAGGAPLVCALISAISLCIRGLASVHGCLPRYLAMSSTRGSDKLSYRSVAPVLPREPLRRARGGTASILSALERSFVESIFNASVVAHWSVGRL